MDEMTMDSVLGAKVGTQLSTTFGVAPATAHCTEVTDGKEGTRKTFRIVSFGVVVANVYSLKKQDGTMAFGETA